MLTEQHRIDHLTVCQTLRTVMLSFAEEAHLMRMYCLQENIENIFKKKELELRVLLYKHWYSNLDYDPINPHGLPDTVVLSSYLASTVFIMAFISSSSLSSIHVSLKRGCIAVAILKKSEFSSQVNLVFTDSVSKPAMTT